MLSMTPPDDRPAPGAEIRPNASDPSMTSSSSRAQPPFERQNASAVENMLASSATQAMSLTSLLALCAGRPGKRDGLDRPPLSKCHSTTGTMPTTLTSPRTKKVRALSCRRREGRPTQKGDGHDTTLKLLFNGPVKVRQHAELRLTRSCDPSNTEGVLLPPKLPDSGDDAEGRSRQSRAPLTRKLASQASSTTADTVDTLFDEGVLMADCVHCLLTAVVYRRELAADVRTSIIQRYGLQLEDKPKRRSFSWPKKLAKLTGRHTYSEGTPPHLHRQLNTAQQQQQRQPSRPGTPDIIVSSESGDKINCFFGDDDAHKMTESSLSSPGPQRRMTKSDDDDASCSSGNTSPKVFRARRHRVVSSSIEELHENNSTLDGDDDSTDVDTARDMKLARRKQTLHLPPMTGGPMRQRMATTPTGGDGGMKTIRAALAMHKSRSCSVELSILQSDIAWLDRNGNLKTPSLTSHVSNEDLGGHRARSKSQDVTPSAGAADGDPGHARSVSSRRHQRKGRLEHVARLIRKALAKSPMMKRTATEDDGGGGTTTGSVAGDPTLVVVRNRTAAFWTEPQNPAEHIWQMSGSSASTHHDSECYIGDKECLRLGDKKRCVACHITTHSGCGDLLSRMNIGCKHTHRDTGDRYAIRAAAAAAEAGQPNEPVVPDPITRHHWVHRWRQDGRCRQCGKSFQQKLFRDKEVIAISCSWCKVAYHNKPGCFTAELIVDDECDRGPLAELIVPPSWLLRVHDGCNAKAGGAAQAGITTAANGADMSTKKRAKAKRHRPFVVKPIGLPGQSKPSYPLLVFVNPKSGGNKGAKMLNTLCWLLNPRQVFDIMALKGPKFGLEMYRKCIAAQLRILICGGDGTVGWVLSTLDALRWPTYPPIAMVPLGTGNDLSRTMGWGGIFSDEPMSQILQAVIHDAVQVDMDRWKVEVRPNTESAVETTPTNAADDSVAGGSTNGVEPPNEAIVDRLPLDVINNYFSIGADAHIALQFHHSRSNNPQLFNSRFKNRLAYGGIGTIDLFRRSWKDLSEYITVVCDGQDLTPKIREGKLHCLLFLNIPHYAGGTTPWGGGGNSLGTSNAPQGGGSPGSGGGGAPSSPTGEAAPGGMEPQQQQQTVFTKPSVSDRKIEVLGFTSATLAALQMSGKAGLRLAQCSQVRITSRKPIPMQVDGEPCLLAPSHIAIDFHCKASMLQRVSGRSSRTLGAGTNAKKRGGAGSGGTSPILDGRGDEGAAGLRGARVNSSPALLSLPVLVISKHDYITFRDDIEKLKETAFETGKVAVEAEMELEIARPLVQQVLEDHASAQYKPSLSWRFLDCLSNAEEGVFRVQQSQESYQTVSDATNVDDCILVMDEHLPSISKRTALFSTSGVDPAIVPLVLPETSFEETTTVLQQVRRYHRRRRVTETLNIVLKSESAETHL